MLSSALQNIKVLDLTRVMAGPWCTQNLADLGAQVIKVERPHTGDDTRGWGPSYIHHGDHSFSSYFFSCNRGKKSITVDFSQVEGLAHLHRLVKSCDVLVENYKPGTLSKYGLGYEELKKINPELIYLSISAYGQHGPKSHKPGYDYVFQGLGGLMSYTGKADQQEGAGPVRSGAAVIDLMTGMYATTAITAALFQRQQTQHGQYIDLALLDVAVAMHANQGADYLLTGKAPVRTGNTHPNCAPYDVFASADGYFILAIGNDEQFQRLRRLLNHADLDQTKFDRNVDRLTHREEITALLTPLLQQQNTAFWGQQLDQHQIPWGPINTLKEVETDEQVVHRQLIQTMMMDGFGEIKFIRNPLTQQQQKMPPPSLGEHNFYFLEP